MEVDLDKIIQLVRADASESRSSPGVIGRTGRSELPNGYATMRQRSDIRQMEDIIVN